VWPACCPPTSSHTHGSTPPFAQALAQKCRLYLKRTKSVVGLNSLW
jgi:hypothetical protein